MTQREKEHLVDESDRATQTEMEFTQDALDEARAKARPQQMPRADGSYETTECVECGEPIGAQRLRVAVKNLICIDCATLQEHRNRRR